MEMLDTDGDGKIDFSEFCIWMAVIPHEQNVIEDMIKEAFCQLNQDINDPDGNGFITLDVFKKILKENIDNEKYTDEEYNEMVKIVADNDQTINYEKFKKIVLTLLAFTILDKDGNGTICDKEMKLAMKCLDKTMPELDLSRDGKFDFLEFMKEFMDQSSLLHCRLKELEDMILKDQIKIKDQIMI